MKYYAHYGIREFFIALGYRGDIIKDFSSTIRPLNGSLSIDLTSGQV
jgi:glucose-1-phosphate cytidylyltransferase